MEYNIHSYFTRTRILAGSSYKCSHALVSFYSNVYVTYLLIDNSTTSRFVKYKNVSLIVLYECL